VSQGPTDSESGTPSTRPSWLVPQPPADTEARVVQVFADVRTARRMSQIALKVGSLYLVIAAVVGAGVAYVGKWHFDAVWQGELVAALGIAVGVTELVSRYRDAPSFALFTWPAFGYITINALASVAALAVVRTENWQFGSSGAAVTPTQILIAGFGAMALFRSSLFTIKAGNQDIGIGPSSVLSITLVSLDRSVDRLRAADRAGRVTAIMKDVSYPAARQPLPRVAVALMQNLDSAEVAALQTKIDNISNEPLPDPTKSLLLGLALTDVVSTAVLSAAKLALGRSILEAGEPPGMPPDGPSREGDIREPAKDSPAERRRETQRTKAELNPTSITDGNSESAPIGPPLLAEGGNGEGSGGPSVGLPQTPQTPNKPK
jgi:hypothetical protein